MDMPATFFCIWGGPLGYACQALGLLEMAVLIFGTQLWDFVDTTSRFLDMMIKLFRYKWGTAGTWL